MTAWLKRHAELATALARSADVNGYHFGAVVFDGPRLISTGWCRTKTHPQQAYYIGQAYRDTYKQGNTWLHAELDAILGVPKHERMPDLDILIARWAGGRLKASLPCRACALAIDKAQLRRVWTYDEHGKGWSYGS